MKLLVISALVLSVASAFTPPSCTFAMGKATKKSAGATKRIAPKATKKIAPKAIKKVAPKAIKKVVQKKQEKVRSSPFKKTFDYQAAPIPRGSSSVQTIPSAALPYFNNRAPAILDGTVPGDAGFDPVFLSVKASTDWVKYFNGITMNSGIDGFTWMREAELMNGRNAMVGVLGMIVPGLFGVTASPLEATGADLFPIVLTMSWMEWFRINNILKEGSNYQAGDMQKWGQGEGDRFNPFGLNYTPEEYANYQLSEVKHCRLAMIGFLGLYLQASASGVSVVTQLSAAFASPDYYTKVGYFMPEGI